jgi:ABC-type amino acid transport substrate-binding protein
VKRIGVVLAVLAIIAVGCGGDSDTPEATSGAEASFPADSFMAELQEKGKLVVGVKFDVPQFGFKNPTTDEVEGFDVDMGARVADALGVEPEYVEAISRNRIPFVQEDKVDIVFSTLTVTEERKQQIDFSDVYYVAEQSFLTKKGEGMTVETAAGKKVCTAKGSTSESNLPAVQPEVEIVLQDGYAQCVQLLRNDQVDAVSTDDVILLQFLRADPELFEVSEDTFSTEPYGAGIKKGRDEFVTFVNSVIQELKADGVWAQIYDKWIKPVSGSSAEPPPADVKFAIEGLATPVPAFTPAPTAAAGTGAAVSTPAPTP